MFSFKIGSLVRRFKFKQLIYMLDETVEKASERKRNRGNQMALNDRI